MSTIGISAEISLKLDKLRQQAREAIDIVDRSFRAAGTKLTVPVDVKLPPDLQARMEKVVANIKVPAVTIPVQFGAPGGMPGGGFPAGAASPNWSFYFGQPGANLGRAGFGNGVGNLINPYGPRGLARLLGSGAMAYGALEGVHVTTGILDAAGIASRPDLIQRQWSHLGDRRYAMADSFLGTQASEMAGNQAAQKVLTTIESVPLAGSLVKLLDATTGLTTAFRDAERVANENVAAYKYNQGQTDRLNTGAAALSGDPLAVRADARKGERNTAVSAIAAEQGTLNAAIAERARTFHVSVDELMRRDRQHPGEGWLDTPAINAARENLSVAQRNETARQRQAGLSDAELGRHVAAGLAGIDAKTGTYRAEAAGAMATMAGDPMAALRDRHDAQSAEFEAQWQAKFAPNMSPQQRAALQQQYRAAQAAMRNGQGLEMFRLSVTQDLTRGGIDSEGRQLDARLRGDPDQAARESLAERQNRRYTQLRQTDAGAAEQYRNDVAPKEQQELEDRIRREREKAEGDSRARIKAIADRADADLLRSTGETYAAQEKIILDATAEQAAALRREAAATEDLRVKRQKLAEAGAVEAAGAKKLAALSNEESRRAADDTLRTDQVAGQSALRSSGQNRAAARQAVRDRFEEEQREIIRRNGPNAIEELTNAAKRHNAAMAELDYQDRQRDRSTNIETRDLEAQARGQEGVGDVLSAAARFDDMARDASGDSGRLRGVARQRSAWVDAYRRSHRRRSRTFGLAEYHDALQQSISDGVRNDDALKLADAMGKGDDILNPRHGVGDKSRFEQGAGGAGGSGTGSGSFASTVDKFDKAIDKMSKKSLVVLK